MQSSGHDMNKRLPPIYPAYIFNESPTWFKWVKLTAATVHGLRNEAGFDGQNVYFHLNHPIRFVSVTGIILSIDDRCNKFTLLELDDGSGKVITIKLTRLASDLTGSIGCPSNTTVSNVDVVSELGRYDVLVNKIPLDIGTVIKIKATINVFRDVKQLELKRIWIVLSTAEEIAEWEEIARWKREVLNQPWVVPAARLHDLERMELERRKMAMEHERAKEGEQRSEELKTVRRAGRKKNYEEKKERKRRQEEIVMNYGALV